MSADNFVGVRPNPNEFTYSIFEYGNMSAYDEDCMYLANQRGEEISEITMATARATALVRAHDIVNEMDICEYGVVEMPPVPNEPCGRCYVCVNNRSIVTSDIQKCDRCNKPISSSDWMTSYYDHVSKKTITIHSSCERRKCLTSIGS